MPGSHRCHAHGCTRAVPPRLFMCRGHWGLLPAALRAAVWKYCVDGQERRKDPSPGYLAVQSFAVGLLALATHGADAAQPYGQRARSWRMHCRRWQRFDPLVGLTGLRVVLPPEQVPLAG